MCLLAHPLGFMVKFGMSVVKASKLRVEANWVNHPIRNGEVVRIASEIGSSSYMFSIIQSNDFPYLTMYYYSYLIIINMHLWVII